MIARNYIFGKKSGGGVSPYLANLVAYYPFNSNSNDFSGMGNNGTDTAISYVNSGLVSNSATFNGTSSKIIVPQSTDFDFSGTFSISLWAKHNASGSTQWIIGKRGVGNLQWQVIFDAGFIWLYIFTDISNYKAGRINTTIVNGVWNNYIITWDLTNIKIYTNGIDLGTSVANIGTYTSMPVTLQDVNIGVLNSIGALYLNGELDETYIYNGRVLSSAEALDIFNKGFAGLTLI